MCDFMHTTVHLDKLESPATNPENYVRKEDYAKDKEQLATKEYVANEVTLQTTTLLDGYYNKDFIHNLLHDYASMNLLVAQLDVVNNRITDLDKVISSQNDKITNLEQPDTALDERITTIEERIHYLENRLDELNVKFDKYFS